MKFKLIFALLIFQLGFSQQKTCGTDAYMQQIMSDPVAKQKYLDLQNRFEIELAKLQDPQNELARSTNATIIIPVAVHFPEVVANSPDKPCLRQLAQNQIDILMLILMQPMKMLHCGHRKYKPSIQELMWVT